MSDKVTKESVVKVHYTGTLPDTNAIFDTSKEEVAKKNNLFQEGRDYQPLEVEMGKNKVIPGFENALVGMMVGESKTVEIPPEEAYGERSDERVVAVPDEQFKTAEITPQAGMQIQTSMGIATVVAYDQSTGNVSLDFNHPLSGQTLKFELEIVSIN